jgi:predicted nucleotidyltransferase component of viral defense system
MKKLFWETITESMRIVLNQFCQTRIGARFYLAGGTALALQLGHRHSVDLDFFSSTEDIPTIRRVLEESLAIFQPTLADSAWGNLVYVVKDVRVGFYGYGYPLVAPLVETENLQLASVEDIALMKLDALLSRAARKDFYDLYFICQKIPLRQLFDLTPKKYSNIRDFEVQTVKRLVYFENAEADTDPVLLQSVSWQDVKQYFIQQAKEISGDWL